MNFKPLELSDFSALQPYFQNTPFQACDFTFANLYIWKDLYPVEFSLYKNVLIFRGFYQANQPVYLYPFGTVFSESVLEEVILALFEDAHSFNAPLVLRGFFEKEAALLLNLFPDRFTLSSSPDQWDYLYLKDDLLQLSGSRYHSKRNHIARFKKTYPDFSFLPVTPENIADCRKVSEIWYAHRRKENIPDASLDETVVNRALSHFHELPLTGGLLYTDKEPVAFTIGEPINQDTYAVHIEKAFAWIPGAYPMINQCYVAAFMNGYTYVNREEDDGIEGLRKAKQSYHPCTMVQKQTAREIRSFPACKA